MEKMMSKRRKSQIGGNKGFTRKDRGAQLEGGERNALDVIRKQVVTHRWMC